MTPETTDEPTQLLLRDLHSSHPGLTQATGTHYCESATVCLIRWHHPPTPFQIDADGQRKECLVDWSVPSPRVERAHANDLDATEEGAYALSILCVYHAMGLVVVHRSPKETGCDWYVALPSDTDSDIPNLDDDSVLPLEVSGTDHGSIARRLREKLAQLEAGSPGRPGLAAVVGFKCAEVHIQRT